MDDVQVKGGVTAGVHTEDALETDWELYNFICSHEACTIFKVPKLLNWSTSKVTQALKRLISANLVRAEKDEVVSGRIVKVIVPVKWIEYFTDDELKEIKLMKF